MGKEIRLTKENILAFIASADMTEEEKYEQLEPQLTLDLLMGPYTFNRTLFHFLVIHNLPVLFECIILTDERFQHCALHTDRLGRTVLHLIVGKEQDHSELLEMVLRTLPVLFNSTNERGDTALDTAIINENTWAIEAILDAKYKLPQLRELNPKLKPASRAYFSDDSKYKNLRMDTGLDVLKVFPAIDPAERTTAPRAQNKLALMFPHLFLRNHSASKSRAGLNDSPKSTGSSPKSTGSSPKGGSSFPQKSEPSLSSSSEMELSRNPFPKTIFKSFPPIVRSGSPLSSSSSRSSNGGSLRTSEDLSMSEGASTTTTTTTTSTSDLAKTALTNSSDLVRNLLNSDVSALERYLQAGREPNITNYLGRPLVIQAFFQAVSACAFGDEQMSVDTQRRFNTILAYADLEHAGTRKKVLKDYLNHRERAREVIQLACISLHQRVSALSTDLVFSLNQKSNAINRSLYDNGLVECYRKSVTKPDFTSIYPGDAAQQELACEIWNLCTLTKKDRYFDKKELSRLILGIQSGISLKNIIRAFIQLFPHFDRYQKLIAGFIVKELILTVNSKAGLETCALTLRCFLEQNIHPDTGLAQDGLQYKELMNELIALKHTFLDHPAVVNYGKLNNWLLYEPTLQVAEECSFDHLVHAALNKPLNDRTGEIKQIAAELRKLSLYYFQHISLDEFERGAWQKDQKATKSPNIVLATKLFNYLSNYFAFIILSQGANNINNSLNFMVELSCELAGHEDGPDLNSLMVISSALDSSPVSRLMNLNAGLDPKDASAIVELNALVSQKGNFPFLRMAISSFPDAIPFMGLFLTDLTMSSESNQILVAADVVAPIFTTILRVKDSAQRQSLIFSTDIFRFFNSEFIPPGNERLDCMSYRIQPFKGDVINLNQIRDYKELFQQLQEHYIDRQLVPVIVFNDTTYPLQRSIQLLLHWVLTHREEHRIAVGELKLFEKMLDKLRNILTHDYTFEPGLCFNPLFYRCKLIEARGEELPSFLKMPVRVEGETELRV
ncbi:RasGEF domain-containing protein [Legionella shakespearei]|uniref:RasGEF domain protein n=1 Tax=Legionella shakespearei DSM 23087 TaxID=1122169 RepID=A0A0W0Z779_9GAMM|nr:RasGEF domain-containing protein [Legionella shakespearei]KTD64969.1 RasGEF domain protein [Legionella shakespearei DSM 23087]